MKLDRAHQRPIAVDLFAGAGGLSLGFEQAGFDVVAAVEIDPIHAAVHHFNFPKSTAICRSVVGLTGTQIREIAGIGPREVDVVCGGAPCQGFSTIGKRALDDPRNQLVHHFCRLVRELQPRYAVLENVKGLTMGAHRAFLDEVVQALSQSGYEVCLPYRVLNAADFGVPQHRQRLFLMAARSGQSLPEYPVGGLRTTVWDAIGDLPDADAFSELLDDDAVPVTLGPGSLYARQLRNEAIDEDDFSHPRIWDTGLMTSSTRTVHTRLSQERFRSTAPGSVEPISRFLKLDPSGVCNTLRAGTDSARGAFTSPRPIHPYWPRVITVREAARLHSYPDWFRLHSTKWHGFRQIGNSVPPKLARAVAGQLMKALGMAPTKPGVAVGLGAESLLRCTMAEAVRLFNLPASPIAHRLRPPPDEAARVLQASLDLEPSAAHA